MVVKPASCFAKSVVACLNWLATIAPPALLVTGVPTVTVPFTAGNNVLTPPSINVLAITAPITSQKQQALKWNEKLLQKLRLSQFKLRYQYREYHFQPAQLAPSAPHRPSFDLTRIHRSSDLLGLVLAFHISFALSARKTAQVLRQVFGVPLSYQSVLNYAQAAAYYCHAFNLSHKAPLSHTATGDETYIRVAGKHQYTFFFLDPQGHHITSYHVAAERDTLAATVALGEAARTLPPDQALRFITDGNPAYQAGVHFLNAHRSSSQPPHTLRQVIGLENLDPVSTEFRPFKQLIERLNRTYKHHVRPACGFVTQNGALALTTLFVTHYNFLRPHSALCLPSPCPLAGAQLRHHPTRKVEQDPRTSVGQLSGVAVDFQPAGAEDRATQGCDLSADPGAGIGWERGQLAPPVQTNPGTNAINPRGLGAKPPTLPIHR